MRICPRSWVCNRSTVVVFRLLGFPHVADFATLAVNKGLLKLQPLARLYARLLYKCNESITSDINRVSGYRHHAALSPERRDPEGESRRDLAVGERSVTHGPPTHPETGVRTGRELPLLLTLQPLHG